VTATTSESNMGGGQVPTKGEPELLSFVFPTASNDIHRSGRARASVGIVDREEGYVN
jgi:hypothetical protein